MKKDSVEVSSDQLKAELIAIKERLGALETIASISNRQVVEARTFMEATSLIDKGKQILKDGEVLARATIDDEKVRIQQCPALDYHLKPAT